MLKRAKTIYKRWFAALMLFTAEALITIILFLTSLIAFLLIAKYVFLDQKEEFDTSAFNFIAVFESNSLTEAMALLSVIGNYQIMIVANILLTAYFLFIRKHRWYSIKIPSIALSSVLLMSVLKIIFNRPRPLVPLMEPAVGLSFPSGHAMNSVTFFGLLIYFVYRRSLHPALKILIVTLLVLFILGIGFSRIYLRVHYASDVLAGFCMGVIWLTIAVRLLDKMENYSKAKVDPVVE